MSTVDKVQPYADAKSNKDEVYEGDNKDVRTALKLTLIDEQVELGCRQAAEWASYGEIMH